MEKVRVGIVGIGGMGTFHAEYLLKGEINGAQLSAVCDIDPKRLDYAKENFGEDVKRFDSFEPFLASHSCDLVLIATPHYFHPPYAMQALEAGYHVLSEKPAGVYTKNVEELIEKAEHSDRVYAIMFNQRTSPVYQRVRDIVKAGQLGELKRVVWTITNWYRSQSYYNSGSWRATWKGEGGGVLINQCPHNLDLMQWICGMPKRVRAFCSFGKYHDIEVEDDVTAYLEYESGATGVFITTTGEAPGSNRLEISGTRGKLIVEDGKIIFYHLEVDEREFNRTNQEGFAMPPCEKIEITIDRPTPGHQGIMQNVVDHILDGKELLAQGREGINSLMLSNAMQLSSWTDDWVDLPVDGDLYYKLLSERIAGSKDKEHVGEIISVISKTFNS